MIHGMMEGEPGRLRALYRLCNNPAVYMARLGQILRPIISQPYDSLWLQAFTAKGRSATSLRHKVRQ